VTEDGSRESEVGGQRSGDRKWKDDTMRRKDEI